MSREKEADRVCSFGVNRTAGIFFVVTYHVLRNLGMRPFAVEGFCVSIWGDGPM